MRSVLLDTNVLLLFLVGRVDPNTLGTKRLKAFDQVDLENLNGLVGHDLRHVSTPNILTEVSNFIGSGKQVISPRAQASLMKYVTDLHEIFTPAIDLQKTGAFVKFGLSDASVVEIVFQTKASVITVDSELFGFLANSGADVTNLRHFRTPV